MAQPPFGAANSAVGNRAESPVSILGSGHPEDDYRDEPSPVTLPHRAGADDPTSFDLKPPPPSGMLDNIEDLSLRFFSLDHLNTILRDQRYSRRFAAFLAQFKPHLLPNLTSYLDTQKAIVAVEYANAIAETLSSNRDGRSSDGSIAAVMDTDFEAKSSASVQELVNEALPAYLTHRLVQITTDTLVKEITGHGTPYMRDMIPSLAEVYCITDPSTPDNPIVYASEEFYKVSQYGKSYVIGRNCRFLQGPETSDSSVGRLIDALKAGKEVTEAILNYRRDGTPFLNLLMIAPLYDNKGAVRYFLGAQVDVSSMIERGRGFESFESLLTRDRVDSRMGHHRGRDANSILAELGAMLNTDELSIIRHATARGPEGSGSPTISSPPRTTKHGRRILGMDDNIAADRALWPQKSLGPSGRLPGVYQNYLLVRPFPSLRITFTSPALRIPGLLQTKFMERISGPSHVREGILDAMSSGISVTARVNWLPPNSSSGSSERGGGATRQRWVHCTPLLGADDKVGVWMVVMVESEEITGRLHARRPSFPESDYRPASSGNNNMRSGSQSMAGGLPARSFTSEKLYQEYLRREGRDGVGTFSRSSSTRET